MRGRKREVLWNETCVCVCFAGETLIRRKSTRIPLSTGTTTPLTPYASRRRVRHAHFSHRPITRAGTCCPPDRVALLELQRRSRSSPRRPVASSAVHINAKPSKTSSLNVGNCLAFFRKETPVLELKLIFRKKEFMLFCFCVRVCVCHTECLLLEARTEALFFVDVPQH